VSGAGHCQWRGDTLVLRCRVRPNARRDAFAGVHAGQLKLCLSAPPVEGRANARAIAFLAASFGVPKSRVKLLRGAAASDKVFAISGPTVIPQEAAVGAP
jgi:uncharacterized protein